MPDAAWRALIADDEPDARLGVRQLLAAYPEFAIVGECRNGDEVLSMLDSARADVVFLDVQMPGADGFEVIRRRTPERMPAVVFLTAYDQFAIQAFEAQAMDYLLKPVTEARFAATMKRVARALGSQAEATNAPTIAVTTARGAAVVPVREIDWIEAAGNYARLWTSGGRYLVRESMNALERRLRGQGFVRAHRGALVRITCVRRLVRAEDGCYAVLSGGVRVAISRRRRGEFARTVRA